MVDLATPGKDFEAVDFNIRRAAPDAEDIDRIASLFDSYRQFYGKPPDAERAKSFIRERLEKGESVIFVAESTPARRAATGSAASGGSDRELLGFVQLYPLFSSVEARSMWVLNDLYVAKEARRGGVGRALMEAARKHAVETGAKRLTLETVGGNRAAWSLYESLGYVCHDTATRFYTLELD